MRHITRWMLAMAFLLVSFAKRPVRGQEDSTFWLHETSVQKIRAAFDSGTLTSERLVEMYLNRIAAYDDQGPSINSILMLNPKAIETARALDIERSTIGPRSILHGIPILLKDQLDTYDMPTTSGSIALKDFIPPDDAFVVRKLREAGAIILGKTNLDEFGCCSATVSSLGGQTRNPYDVTRITGGSSGGTAAAIAANFAVMGTGSDWLGSIQEPSSFQSVVGFMPTRALISGDGGSFSSERRGVTGVIARGVGDAAAMLGVIAGVDPADPVTASAAGKIAENYLEFLDANGLRGARIGVVQNYLSARGDVRNLFDRATSQLQAAGAEIVPLRINWSGLFDSYYNDIEYKMNRYLDSLGPDAPYSSLRELIASRNYLPSLNENLFRDLQGDIPPEQDPEYAPIIALREELERVVLNVMDTEQLDALVYPPLLSLPPEIGATGTIWESAADFRNMNVSPFLGFPSITMPAGVTPSGLPVGIEFLGRPFSEPTLIRLAYSFEQSTHSRVAPRSTPPLPGEVPLADLNWNGIVDAGDIDLLTIAIRLGRDLTYDLDHSGQLDEADRSVWVHKIRATWFGDANLDSLFDSSDLIAVFQAGQFEDAVEDNSGWASGDWDGDGDFSTRDIIIAFQDGGYENGRRIELARVPEPSGAMVLLVCLSAVVSFRHRMAEVC